MPQNLVIVESPAKAKTIESYLGPNYKVASSNGHIRDLPKSGQAIDIQGGFKPTYEITEGKQQLVRELKKLATSAQCVYLASDDDREGESISWHLKEALELDDPKIRRIVFREITKTAVLKAIDNPRTIDTSLVDSQQARRILDRLVGFELSPVLWKKIKRGLSAGRVQSVAVRLVVERERAIHHFQATPSFAITALFDLGNKKHLQAELYKKLDSEEEAHTLLEKCQEATFTVQHLEKKPAKRSPSAPFTTSTLQQEASSKLGYSVTRTMLLAQHLYEAGKITYMRTDSVNLSQEAIGKARQEIEKSYGTEYFQGRTYKTKSATAQEAHEAIRPTNFSQRIASHDKSEQRLYELIWRRAMASQMADAQLEKTIATIAISTTPTTLVAKGEVVKFEGFLKASATNEDAATVQHTMLPPLSQGEVLVLDHMQARERFSKPPARYTEASLVKQLEERGIGRPSTYAPTISTIQKRGYIVKDDREGTQRSYTMLTLANKKIEKTYPTEIVGAERKKLFPTDTAMVVNDFLVDHFAEITNYDFTAQIEGELDAIAQGGKSWQKVLSDFYDDFHLQVEKTTALEATTVNKARKLGTDPKTGLEISARLGKYGPLVQLGDNEGEQTPKFASLQENQRLETITLEEALKLFALPRTLATFEDHPMVVKIGRFGPYIHHESKFYSLPKEEDPHTITSEQAVSIIQAKRKADAEKIIKQFEEDATIQVLNGRWGAYIKAGKENIKIPKDITDPSSLTLQQCKEIVDNAPAKKPRPKRAKK